MRTLHPKIQVFRDIYEFKSKWDNGTKLSLIAEKSMPGAFLDTTLSVEFKNIYYVHMFECFMYEFEQVRKDKEPDSVGVFVHHKEDGILVGCILPFLGRNPYDISFTSYDIKHTKENWK